MRERLAAFDLVAIDAEGYRMAPLPWYATPNADWEDYRDATARGVLLEAFEDLVDDPARFGDPDDPVYRATAGDAAPLVDRWPWIRPLVDAAAVIAADDPGGSIADVGVEPAADEGTAAFGPDLEQTPLATDATGRTPA